MFAAHILKIEGEIEVVQYLHELELTLKTRQEDDFLSISTLVEKKALEKAGYAANVVLSAKCGEFFLLFLVSISAQFNHNSIIFPADALEYINKWAAPTKQLELFSWATLRKAPAWKEVEAVMMNLSEHKLFDTENAAQLHTEFTYVKNYCG